MESEDEETEEVVPSSSHMPPPKSIRSDAGNYELESDFGNMEEPNRSVPRGVKTNAESTKGKSDIMSVAQEMQKKRDSEIEENDPRKKFT